jgi:hypothetical protein
MRLCGESAAVGTLVCSEGGEGRRCEVVVCEGGR